MSKFSVRKPLTVLVAVVIVLVLGIVSFSRMTPDLMPNLDMPYVMVITPYPGATPEEVEQSVSKPMEQSMSTLENIKEVSSTSSPNFSLVSLQFNENVNMDTISVDILQKINLISDNWGDLVGTPTILKINPTMMPVSVAAVSYDGKKTGELSTFLKETLMNKLEGIAGVASITASGNVDQKLSVTLNQDKIDHMNKVIRGEIDESFAEAESQLNDAQAKINSGKAELESGQAQLLQGQKELAEKTAEGSAQINAQQMDLAAAKAQINTQLTALQTQLAELEKTEAGLLSTQTSIQQLESAKAELETAIAQLQTLQSTVETLESSKAAMDAAMTEEQKAQSAEYQQVVAGLATIDAQLAAQGLSRDTIGSAITSAQSNLDQVNAGLSQIDAALGAQGLSRGDVANALAEVSAGKSQISSAISQLQSTQQQLESGSLQLNQAMKELEKQKTAGILQMSGASAQLISGQSQLAASQAQVDQGLEQMKEAKKTAHESTNLDNILSMDTMAKILSAQNFSMPAGYVEESGQKYLVSVGEKITSLNDLEDLVLLDLGLDGVKPIRVSDVADVMLTDNSDEVYANINGNDGILLSFSKQSNYATATTADNINAKFAQLEEEFPGLHFTVLMDQGGYIYETISSIMQSLVLGAIFAAVILFLFLKDLKPTIIVICSIPISVIFAFVLMYFSGITLNMISMAGLAIAVGMLVDNSVVVIENIYRLRNKGISAVKSAIIGASQVAAAIAASTLTTVCVFLPIVFVEGLTRQLFTDLALTMAYALLASLIVALTLVPTMSSRILRKEPKQHKDRIFNKLIGFYEKTLRWALKYKIIVLIGSVVLLIGSGVATMARGFTMMPEMNAAEITLNLTMPDEAVLADTRKVANEAVSRMKEIEGIEDAGAMLTSADGNMFSLFGAGEVSPRNVIFYLTLKDNPGRSSKEITEEALNSVSDLEGEFKASDSAGSSGMMNMFGNNGVTIRVYSEDLEHLRESAKLIAAKLETVEGTEEVSDGMDQTDPAIEFVVDKEKAAAHGLTVAQVYQKVAEKISTENAATNVTFDGDNYDVVIANGKKGKLTPKWIKECEITVEKQDGTKETVALTDLAEIKDTETLSSIKRINQKRYLEVTAKVDDDHNITLVTEAAKSALEDVELPADTTYSFNGGNEDIMSSMKDLALMLMLGVLLIYLIMVAQFQSLKHPFIIMFTIPLAFTGGLLSLLISGMEVSVISMMGFVMLCGIIVNNGIVLVDYINQLRLAGLPKREALVEAGKTRMRPILMTTITTILGLVVMALGIGSGNEMMQPIAIVCIGGLLYATLLTLYIVPIIYDLMNRKEMKRLKKEDLDFTAEEMLEDEFAAYREKHNNGEKPKHTAE